MLLHSTSKLKELGAMYGTHSPEHMKLTIVIADYSVDMPGKFSK